MSSSSRFLRWTWLVFPVFALGFMIRADSARFHRVQEVSALTAAGNAPRRLIVPERNENAYRWLAQAGEAIRRDSPRQRHFENENAPFGYEATNPLLYRWWLETVAWGIGIASGRTTASSLETAALFADPIVHGLLLLTAVAFVAWRIGAWAASVVALGVAMLFPFAGEFLPGAPDSRGLSAALAFGSMLLVTAAVREAGGNRMASRIFLGLAGTFSGLGLWLDLPVHAPLILGVAGGALVVPLLVRGERAAWMVLPWRVWSIAGAVTVFVAVMLEYFPGGVGSWKLDTIHPFYGLAWLGLGELLARFGGWRSTDRRWRLADTGACIAALGAMATVPVTLALNAGRGFGGRDLLWARLTSLPGEQVTAANLAAWLGRAGWNSATLACLIPLLALAPAAWLVFGRKSPLENRVAALLTLGPGLVAAGFACSQLSWWSVVGVGALATVVAMAPAAGKASGWPFRLAAGCIGLSAMLAWDHLVPAGVGSDHPLNAAEAEEVIECHLARWLVQRTDEPGAVVFASPHATTTLTYYAELKGIGSFNPDDQAGFGTALGIAGANTMEEVQSLLRARGVRFLVLPSWDPFFDDFARLYLSRQFSNRTSLLASELRNWHLPPWLRPIPYQLPVGGDFQRQSVRVFEVVDEQSPALAAARLAEYLVEIDDLQHANAVAESLQRFPGDVGALAARSQVLVQMLAVPGYSTGAQGGRQALAALTRELQTRLAAGGDRYLPWDRRVSVAIVLARAGASEDSRQQVMRCLAEVDEQRLRDLSTGSLFGLQVLAKAFGLQIADPRLRALALELVPPGLRERI